MAVKGPESTAEHRRAVHLTYVPPPADSTIPSPRSAPTPPRRSAGEKILLVAERVMGGWAPTLRLALLMAGITVAGLVVVAFTVGVAIAALCGLVMIIAAILTR